MSHATIQAQNDVDTDPAVLDLIMGLPVRLQREALDWLLVNGCVGRSTLRLLNICCANELTELVLPSALYRREVNMG